MLIQLKMKDEIKSSENMPFNDTTELNKWVMLFIPSIYCTHITLSDMTCFKWLFFYFFSDWHEKSFKTSHVSRCDMSVKTSVILNKLLSIGWTELLWQTQLLGMGCHKQYTDCVAYAPNIYKHRKCTIPLPMEIVLRAWRV
jgi:hypothetical protein